MSGVKQTPGPWIVVPHSSIPDLEGYDISSSTGLIVIHGGEPGDGFEGASLPDAKLLAAYADLGDPQDVADFLEAIQTDARRALRLAGRLL